VLSFENITPISNTDFTLYRIFYGANVFVIQSKYRISRFLNGFERASMRQWERYHFASILGGEIPDVLIDIGANIGEFSYAAVKLGIPRVISVEPDFVARECLIENLREINVEIVSSALGDQIQKTSFYLNTATADSSLDPNLNDAIEIEVEMETLDHLISSHKISGKIALKMDAEGFEIEVLKGATNLLKSVHWIGIDGGPERGGKPTYAAVVEKLK